jgi:hypothetical protein
MNSGILLIETPERPTGESLQMWLNQELSACRTGESKPVNVVYHTSSNFQDASPPDLLTFGLAPTDPGASDRVREPFFADWARNLSQLNAVAREIIPGLRNLTTSERNNLRQHYRTLCRKF